MGLIYGILIFMGFEVLTGYGPVGYVREVLRVLREGRPRSVDVHVEFSSDDMPDWMREARGGSDAKRFQDELDRDGLGG